MSERRRKTNMGKVALPVIDSCEGCGACCTYVGSPPGYALFCPPPGRRLLDWTKGTPDHALWLAMPRRLRAELRAYYARCLAEGDGRDGEPCVWFDEDTRRCKHHEHRPSVCREFEVGGEDCRRVRDELGVDPGP
jgi:uncharacterized protein